MFFISHIINENLYYYQVAEYFLKFKVKINNATSSNNTNKKDQSYTYKLIRIIAVRI
jgi:hypothetical protein